MGHQTSKEQTTVNAGPQITALPIQQADHYTAIILLMMFITAIIIFLAWLGINHLKRKFIGDMVNHLERPSQTTRTSFSV